MKRDSDDTNNEMIPAKFYLSQNYPNPFKGKTKIKYCVPYKTEITIFVFNSEGEFLEKLLNKEQNAGTYEVEFDAKDLPGGTYIYGINAQRESGQLYVENKEMVLVR